MLVFPVFVLGLIVTVRQFVQGAWVVASFCAVFTLFCAYIVAAAFYDFYLMLRYHLTPRQLSYYRRRASIGEEELLRTGREMWENGEPVPGVLFRRNDRVSIHAPEFSSGGVVRELASVPPWTEYVVELPDGSTTQLAQGCLAVPGSAADAWAGGADPSNRITTV